MLLCLVCFTSLASFFLPSHLSLKQVYIWSCVCWPTLHVHDVHWLAQRMSHVHVLRNMSVLQSVYGYSYSRDPDHIRHECTTQISLLNAADCLYYRFNRQEWVRYIWAFGLLAAGQSSTMTVSATTCTCALYSTRPKILPINGPFNGRPF